MDKASEKITGFSISGFQGIRKGEITDLGDINLIVGRNGCGKTTLLEALFLVSDLFTQRNQPRDTPMSVLYSDFYARGRTENGKLNWLLARRNLNSCSHSDVLSSRNIKLYLGSCFTDTHWYANDTSRPIEFVVRMQGAGKFGLNIKRKDNNTVATLDLSDKLMSNWDEHIASFFSPAVFLDAKLLMDSRIERELWELVLKTGKKEYLKDLFNRIYPIEITSIDYSPRSQTLFVTPKDTGYGVRLDNLGTGMRIGFRLLLIASFLRNTMLLIEEFDTYQHPDSLDLLVRTLTGIAKENHIQVFATTHRQESLRAFLAHAKDLEGRVVVPMLANDGVLKTRTIPFKDADGLFEAGVDFRRLEDFQA